jgi:peptidoglycan hydrolase CwlO-like protein
MSRLKKICVLILIAFTAFSWTYAYPNKIFGKAQSVNPHEELEKISEEEKDVLGHLFILSQEIENIERRETEITEEIKLLENESNELQKIIDKQQADYDSKLDILKQVLVIYQRKGSVSFLDMLLNAENLTSLLRSINVIKDFTRNTNQLLSSLQEQKSELVNQKNNLSNNIALLADKKEQLQISLNQKLKVRQELENRLAVLGEDRAYYESYLNDLDRMWQDIKVLFSDIVGDFTRLMMKSDVSMDTFYIQFGFPYLTGQVDESILNSLISENLKPPLMVFHFYPGKVQIDVPEKNLILKGTFVIEGKSTLKFVVDEGTFYDMPLKPESIDELFRNGNITIDFRELAGDITLAAVEILEGCIRFKVKYIF